MSRYYELGLINRNTGKIATRTDGSQYLWGTNLTGQYDPGALDIEFDIIVVPYDTPAGGSVVTIYGIPPADLRQSANFMGTAPGKGYQFYLKGGFTAGLPLVNPAQAGVLVRGTILQSYANWEGTEMSLDFVLNADIYSPQNPGNFVLNCRAGQTLSSALKQTFSVVYPNYGQKISISDQVKWAHDEIGFWPSLAPMAQSVMEVTKGMLGDTYPGVSIWISNDTIFAADGTVAPQSVKQLVYTDLIGQPRWQSLNELLVFLNLRGDISVGDHVQMPQNSAGVPGFVTTTADAANASVNLPMTFEGTFQVTQVRQLGRLRDPNAGSWSTVLYCAPLQIVQNAS